MKDTINGAFISGFPEFGSLKMLIAFLVRNRMSSESYQRFYTDIKGAFELACIIDEHPKTIEFKCLYDEVVLTEIPGSTYKPSKLVQVFDYTKD